MLPHCRWTRQIQLKNQWVECRKTRVVTLEAWEAALFSAARDAPMGRSKPLNPCRYGERPSKICQDKVPTTGEAFGSSIGSCPVHPSSITETIKESCLPIGNERTFMQRNKTQKLTDDELKLNLELAADFHCKWREAYTLAFQFYQQHGNLHVPSNRKRLQKFIYSERLRAKKETYPPIKRQLLSDIGFDFEDQRLKRGKCQAELRRRRSPQGKRSMPDYPKSEDESMDSGTTGELKRNLELAADFCPQWRKSYKLAFRFYQQHGNLQVPANEQQLRTFIYDERFRAKKETYPPIKRQLLSDVGFDFEDQRLKRGKCQAELGQPRSPHDKFSMVENPMSEDESMGSGTERELDRNLELAAVFNPQWREAYKLAFQFYQQHGNLDVPNEGKRLRKFIYREREKAKKETYSPIKRQLLSDVGFDFEDQRLKWGKCQVELSRSRSPHDKRSMVDYPMSEDESMGSGTERELDRNLELAAVFDPQWGEAYKLAFRFYQQHGNLQVPKDRKRLRNFIYSERVRAKKETYSPIKRQLLSDVGFDFEDQRLKRGKCQAELRRSRSPHDKRSMGENPMSEDEGMGSDTERELNRNLELAAAFDPQWREAYKLAFRFYQRNGNLLVPGNERRLQYFIYRERHKAKKGTYSPVKRQILTAVGFDFTDQTWKCGMCQGELKRSKRPHNKRSMLDDPTSEDDSMDSNTEDELSRNLEPAADISPEWKESYKLALQFYQRNDHLQVPKNEQRLRRFICRQRCEAKEETYSPLKRQMLTAIGLDFKNNKSKDQNRRRGKRRAILTHSRTHEDNCSLKSAANGGQKDVVASWGVTKVSDIEIPGEAVECSANRPSSRTVPDSWILRRRAPRTEGKCRSNLTMNVQDWNMTTVVSNVCVVDPPLGSVNAGEIGMEDRDIVGKQATARSEECKEGLTIMPKVNETVGDNEVKNTEGSSPWTCDGKTSTACQEDVDEHWEDEHPLSASVGVWIPGETQASKRLSPKPKVTWDMESSSSGGDNATKHPGCTQS